MPDWQKQNKNLDRIAFMMKGVEPDSMVFLPEMFNTSYVLISWNTE